MRSIGGRTPGLGKNPGLSGNGPTGGIDRFPVKYHGAGLSLFVAPKAGVYTFVYQSPGQDDDGDTEGGDGGFISVKTKRLNGGASVSYVGPHWLFPDGDTSLDLYVPPIAHVGGNGSAGASYSADGTYIQGGSGGGAGAGGTTSPGGGGAISGNQPGGGFMSITRVGD